jgi:hypothetical protein
MTAPISRIGVRTYGMDTSDVGRRRTDGKFAQVMRVAGRALGAAGSVVAPFVPGGAVVKAAVMGASAFASSASSGDLGADPTAGAAGMAGLGTGIATATGAGAAGVADGGLGGMSDMSMSDMLAMQLAVQHETLTYQAFSNVAKARHDAAMNSVRNFKG